MARGTALITGASAGIGRALAREFAKNDFDLVITARREENLQQLAEELDTVAVRIVVSDLGTQAGIDGLLEALDDTIIDVLVNNAGIAWTGNFHEFDKSQVDGLISLNVTALSQLTHAFLPSMIERGKGKILNVASVAAFSPVPAMSLYAASKAFVLSLTEALSEELKGTGVSVTALCPGLTRTEMADELTRDNVVPEFAMASAEEVAREGYDALMAREVIRIPGWANQAAVTWAQFQPRWLVRSLGGAFARINPANR